MKLSEQTINEWKSHPATIEFRKLLEENKRETMQKWAARTYLRDRDSELMALGEIAVIDAILEGLEIEQ